MMVVKVEGVNTVVVLTMEAVGLVIVIAEEVG